YRDGGLEVAKKQEEISRKKKKIKEMDLEIKRIRQSASFIVGWSILKAMRPSVHTLKLPSRLGKLTLRELRNRRIFEIISRRLLRWLHGDFGPAEIDFPPFQVPEIPSRRKLRVAAILDVFSFNCFKPEANFLNLGYATWQEELMRHKPDLLLVESAWHGRDQKWKGSLIDIEDRPDTEIRPLVAYCKAHGIPTVFWNKEDPTNYHHFIACAKLFDHIFTTDADRIEAYKAECGHDRIYALPFAAQPLIHNPVRFEPAQLMDRPRLHDICFAGGWYGSKKHSDRKKDLPIVLDAAIRYVDFHIFDRFHSLSARQKKSYRFPRKYQRFIRGHLDYDRMVSAYRKYRVFLNTNSVSNSPTMFARRVFELMASGTPVLSTPSVGMEAMLGAHVYVARDTGEAASHLQFLLDDEERRRRLAHLAFRHVMREHTYDRRFADILSKIGLDDQSEDSALSLVSIVLVTNRPENLVLALENVRRQTWSNRELVLVLNSDAFDMQEVEEKTADLGRVTILSVPEDQTLGACMNRAMEVYKGAYWAKFDDDDYYGPEYLADQILAFSYTDAGIVGKYALFGYLEGSKKMTLRFPGQENRYAQLVAGATMVVKREVSDKIRFQERSTGEDTQFQKQAMQEGYRIYSTDKYNYMTLRKADLADQTWKIEDKEYLLRCEIVGDTPDLEYVTV
ncbi:MAG: glycosyltransferase, partial [Pseudomonadota bacterium]|nr:glycosyltransferase [Pseudomonadota bacterium]